jgi:uncharacterized membrane protein
MDHSQEQTMASFKLIRRVEAPIDVVFDIFSDIPRADKMIDAIVKIEMLTDGPVGVGTRWRETRLMFKREATEEMEVTAFDPGRSYTVGCESCGCEYESTWRFDAEGDATHVEFEMGYRPLTFFAKVMSPLGRLMMPMMKKCFENDFQALKELAESGDTPDAAQGHALA